MYFPTLSFLAFFLSADLSANKEDSLNVSSIVIGVITAVLITGLIVVIIFLTMKIRRLKSELLSLIKDTVGKLDGKKIALYKLEVKKQNIAHRNKV